MQVGLRERNLDAILVQDIIDILLDFSDIGYLRSDTHPHDNQQVNTALTEVLEQHLYALAGVIAIQLLDTVDDLSLLREFLGGSSFHY